MGKTGYTNNNSYNCNHKLNSIYGNIPSDNKPIWTSSSMFAHTILPNNQDANNRGYSSFGHRNSAHNGWDWNNKNAATGTTGQY